MPTYKGFWSYVHADDKAEGGRIVGLSRDLKAQFELISGEEISLFLDKDKIKWGENWRSAIDSNLESVAFFIPILTPRYFMSAECRHELQSFARCAKDLGFNELILPLLYIDVPALSNNECVDELIISIRDFQREDWRELRFSDVDSERYRAAVARMASRLVEFNRSAEASGVQKPILRADGAEPSEEPPGTIEQMAAFEEKLGQLPETVKQITQEIESIGQIMLNGKAAIEQSDLAGKGFAGRLAVTGRLAVELSGPVDRICSACSTFVSQIRYVDQGTRIIVERAPQEIKENPLNKEKYCDFFSAIRGLRTSSQTSSQSLQGMVKSSEPLENLSREMRPILRRLKQGLTLMTESMKVCDEWVSLIEASEVTCED